jgi:hypothetical protein
MTKPIVTIHDLETNEIVEREMTTVEFNQYKIDQELAIAGKVEAEAKAQIRASALAKLAAIGLTQEEIDSL